MRGGGSKADLAAFDTEPVARAVATSPVPVWTGIGHTGDQSVADIVANRAFVTPTECGHELVRRVAGWWEAVTTSARHLARVAKTIIEDADARHSLCRQRLVGTARGQVHRHAERVESRAARVAVQARRQLDAAATSVDHRAGRLGPLALMTVGRQEERLGSLRRLLAAYDIERQLDRGYSLTLDAEGRLVRSATALSPGETIVTRFADGTARSTVQNTAARSGQSDEDRP